MAGPGICVLTCICIWLISQIQTRLFKVVGPGLVSTSPAFLSSSARHPAGPHGRHAQNGKSDPHCWGREGPTQIAQQLVSAVTAPPLVGCVVWSLPIQVAIDYNAIMLMNPREHNDKAVPEVIILFSTQTHFWGISGDNIYNLLSKQNHDNIHFYCRQTF